jgi:hypothetical protein
MLVTGVAVIDVLPVIPYSVNVSGQYTLTAVGDARVRVVAKKTCADPPSNRTPVAGKLSSEIGELLPGVPMKQVTPPCVLAVVNVLLTVTSKFADTT